MKRRAVADPVNLACKKLFSTIDDISELVAAIFISVERHGLSIEMKD